MRTPPWFLLSVGLLLTVTFAGCSNSSPRASPPTASKADLTTTEHSKIDKDLLRLMSDSVQITDVPSRRRPDGTRAYAVRIRTSDLDALRAAGVSPDSTTDGMVWAYLSLAEIRGLAQLETVTTVLADNDPLPRAKPDRR